VEGYTDFTIINTPLIVYLVLIQRGDLTPSPLEVTPLCVPNGRERAYHLGKGSSLTQIIEVIAKGDP
jgi:hypothetical protein